MKVEKLFYFLIFVFLAYTLFVTRERKVAKKDVQIESATDTLSFKDSVYSYILSLNIQHPDIVLKQAILETGNFSSKICKENNNLFGMKVAKQRPTTATGEQYNHAKYDSWQLSVVDYALWQTKYCHNLTKNEYLEHIQRVYSTNRNYVKYLKMVKI